MGTYYINSYVKVGSLVILNICVKFDLYVFLPSNSQSSFQQILVFDLEITIPTPTYFSFFGNVRSITFPLDPSFFLTPPICLNIVPFCNLLHTNVKDNNCDFQVKESRYYTHIIFTRYRNT